MSAAQIADCIRRNRFRFEDEKDLQDGIAIALDSTDWEYKREVILGRDRLDFLVDGSVALEVKIAGSRSALVRQLHRYAQQVCVEEIIAVVSRSQLKNLPDQMNGKPVVAVGLSEVML